MQQVPQRRQKKKKKKKPTEVKKILEKNVLKQIQEHPKFHQEMRNIGEGSPFPSWKRMQNGPWGVQRHW